MIGGAVLASPLAASTPAGLIGRPGIFVTAGAWSEGTGHGDADEFSIHYNQPLTAGFDLRVDAVRWSEFSLRGLEIPGAPPEPIDPGESPDETSEIRVGGLVHHDSATGKLYAAASIGWLSTEFPRRESESGGVYAVECGFEIPWGDSVAVILYGSWRDAVGIDNVDLGRVELGTRVTVNLGSTWRILMKVAYRDDERWGGAAGLGWQW